MGQKLGAKRTSKTKAQATQQGLKEFEIPDTEAYEKLFNPQYNSVSGDRGLCAALCYLVGAFIRHRKLGPGSLKDGNRQSLRLAVAALSRHPVFEEELPDKDSGGDSDIVEFRRGALALIPLLDAALAWKPVDPWGWFGKCEDDAPLLVAHIKGMSNYATFAARLKKSLNKAASGDTVTWRRLSVHLDAVRVRDLPAPWSWIWVQAQDASMLVRNHTKVPLKVELYRPGGTKISPWDDWPLLRKVMVPLLASFGLIDPSKSDALIVAEVGPGIEWALRPRAREGRHFELMLKTEAGVTVCSKRLRRGQTFDFRVNVPNRRRPVARNKLSDIAEAAKATKEVDDDEQSVASTAAPPSSVGGASNRLSIASATTSASGSTASGTISMLAADRQSGGKHATFASDNSQKPAFARPVPMRGISEMPAGEDHQTMDSSICPRCLRETRARFTRPTANCYAEGVCCDRCSCKILTPEGKHGPDESEQPFFHCRRCFHDLCYRCAKMEMEEVWWGQE